ncbi:bifunctional DNA primase/polymerase [Amaricoccus solimangrovi]|uniref:DNA primase/polymerase bifunctional N-terminal domain-containing protein n=1 Tax=Amaricoccus solimangrovi TaxID=2589815 RepID=A0A501WJ62_9RHOB|nr:bifunctional DNA primase/polymerase [Amaricoccus solimangrovi]TPE47177.1 hypothetical protein FJM51_20650 [Amaricoccus solimangrovi]
MTDLRTRPEKFTANALAFAKSGMHVFPCFRTKEPMTRNGHKDATTSPDTIEQWAATLDDPQIGVACAASGLVVVDVDDVEAFSKVLSDRGRTFPRTTQVITPSGGIYYYFRARPGARYKGKLCDGVDIKNNGYVLAPPSVAWSRRAGCEGTYRWVPNSGMPADAPAWLEKTDARPSMSTPSPGSRPPVNLDQLEALVGHIDPDDGGYDRWLKILMSLHDATGGSPGALALAERCGPREGRSSVRARCK